MPLNKKGKKIMKAMKKQYGADEGEAVFYASKNKGVIDEVERKALGGSVKSKKEKLAAIAEPFDEVTQRDVITARKEKLKFKDGKTVKANRQKAQKQRDKQARKLALEEMEGRKTKSRGRGDLDKLYDRDFDYDALPSSMKKKTELGTFVRFEKFPETKFEKTMLSEKIKAKRARAEKRVQEEMGSFESGGVVKAAILIMDSGPQPEKAQVKGTKFSGTF